MNFETLRQSYDGRSVRQILDDIENAPQSPNEKTILQYRLDKVDFALQNDELQNKEEFAEILMQLENLERSWR